MRFKDFFVETDLPTYEEDDRPIRPRWIHPDRVNDLGGRSFIYMNDGNMVYGKPYGIHADMIKQSPQLVARYGRAASVPQKYIDFDLIGRFSLDRKIVSFWNKDAELYKKLLRPCCEKLLTDKHIDQNTKVSTPIHGTMPMSNVFSDDSAAHAPVDQMVKQGSEKVDIGGRVYDKSDVYRALHVSPKMSPERQSIEDFLRTTDDPYFADAKARISNKTYVEKPWPKALKNAGLLKPGQKWWAPNSESTKLSFGDFVAETERNEGLDWLMDPSNLPMLGMVGAAGAYGAATLGNTLRRMTRSRKPSQKEFSRAMSYYRDLIKQYVQDYGPDSPEVEKLAAHITEVLPEMDFLVRGYRDEARSTSSPNRTTGI